VFFEEIMIAECDHPVPKTVGCLLVTRPHYDLIIFGRCENSWQFYLLDRRRAGMVLSFLHCYQSTSYSDPEAIWICLIEIIGDADGTRWLLLEWSWFAISQE